MLPSLQAAFQEDLNSQHRSQLERTSTHKQAEVCMAVPAGSTWHSFSTHFLRANSKGGRGVSLSNTQLTWRGLTLLWDKPHCSSPIFHTIIKHCSTAQLLSGESACGVPRCFCNLSHTDSYYLCMNEGHRNTKQEPHGSL